MSNDQKFSQAISAIQSHIKEEFLDMTDPGDLSDKDLIELDNSMGELARAVIHILGLELIEIKSESKFVVALSLQTTENMEL